MSWPRDWRMVVRMPCSRSWALNCSILARGLGASGVPGMGWNAMRLTRQRIPLRIRASSRA